MNSTTGKNGASIAVGDLLLMRYGYGTQPVRVRDITTRGGLKIDRFIGSTEGASGWSSTSATVSAKDERIIGALPLDDKRRKLSTFGTQPAKASESQ